MPTQLEQSVQRDLDRIRAGICEMSDLVQKALRDCLQVLVEGDPRRAYAIILRDQYIDDKEKEIDRLCLDFLVRHQPAAGLLRFAHSSIKINMELEAAGDCAESIARQSLKILPLPAAVPRERLIELADRCLPMLRDALQSYLQQDEALARKTAAIEDTVDVFKSQLKKELAQHFQEQRFPFRVLNALLMIVRHLERVADQAYEICTEVLYWCTGEYAKHQHSDVFHVLFVDEYHACRSQLAEAIAQSLNAPGFIFSSAGLEPRPVDPVTVEFMKAKGLDLSRAVPRAIHQVPQLDQCQVIVALAARPRKAFPERPRKVVFLDWSVADPSQFQGTPEQVQAEYEKTYAFLRSHIQYLVEAILGTQDAGSTNS